jgi:hypothetical protein
MAVWAERHAMVPAASLDGDEFLAGLHILHLPKLADGGHADVDDTVCLADLFPDTVRTLSDPVRHLGSERFPGDNVFDDSLRISQ